MGYGGKFGWTPDTIFWVSVDQILTQMGSCDGCHRYWEPCIPEYTHYRTLGGKQEITRFRWVQQGSNPDNVFTAEELKERWLMLLESKRLDEQYQGVKTSLEQVGFVVPTSFYGEDDNLIHGNGHHRLAAAIELGYTHIPMVRVTDTSEIMGPQWSEDLDIDDDEVQRRPTLLSTDISVKNPLPVRGMLNSVYGGHLLFPAGGLDK
jgi:hypothetical protein